MRRPTGAAGAQLARHAEPTRQGLPKVWGDLQPAQSERNFRKLFRHEALEMRRI